MSHYGYDAEGWYTGLVDDDAALSTPIAPPIDSVDNTPDLDRARWYRYEWRTEPYTPVPVPDQAETWRAHYVLTAHGYFDAVMAAIEAIEDPAQRNLARAEFLHRPVIHRISYWTQALQQLAGISDAERDQMFVETLTL